MLNWYKPCNFQLKNINLVKNVFFHDKIKIAILLLSLKFHFLYNQQIHFSENLSYTERIKYFQVRNYVPPTLQKSGTCS